MPTYPSTLPAPLADGYALSPVDPVIRTEMETGASRSRRRSKSRNDVLDVAFLFSDAEFLAFRDWYDDDATGLAGGVSWFTISLPVGNGGATVEEAKFKEIWKAGKVSSLWRVTGKLEIR